MGHKLLTLSADEAVALREHLADAEGELLVSIFEKLGPEYSTDGGATPDGPLPGSHYNEGNPEAFEEYDFADDGLGWAVREALRELAADGKEFVKSKRVATHLDLEAEQKDNVEVGKRLAALADADEPIVEKWSPGNGSAVWRICLGD